MSKQHRYTAVPGTMRSLFTRQLANDEVNTTAAWADHIIELVRNELSERDLEQLRALLAGGEVDEAEPIKGVEARVAQDSLDSFNKLFPSAARIGRDPGYNFR